MIKKSVGTITVNAPKSTDLNTKNPLKINPTRAKTIAERNWAISSFFANFIPLMFFNLHTL